MTCEHCDREIVRHEVLLVLAMRKRVTFCSDTCEHRWMVAELNRRWLYLHRIYCVARGRLRDIAHTALRTNLSP